MTLADTITETDSPSYSVDIFIAGDRQAAVTACREFCLRGLCVSITDADYVFTGGMETGVRVGLINYPRFPKQPDELFATAVELARHLVHALHQQSCSVVGPDRTVWLSRRTWA